MHVGDGDERPCEKISMADAFEPSCFCRETCCGVEVPDCALDAGEFVDVLYCLCGAWVVCVDRTGETSDYFGGSWDDVGGVEGLKTHWAIQEKSICVDVGDVCLEWDAPELGFGASPPFEDRCLRDGYFRRVAVIDVDFVSIADGDVTCLGKFAAAEEGLVGKRGHYVDCTGWFTDVVFQLGDGRGRGRVAVGQGKYFGRFLPSWDEGVANHAGVGCACRVPCR